MLQLSEVIANRFPGKDTGPRLQAFRMGLSLMGENPDLGPAGIDAMLGKATEPGVKGDKLLNAFESQATALRDGTAGVEALTEGRLRLDREGRFEEVLGPDGRPERTTREKPAVAQPAEAGEKKREEPASARPAGPQARHARGSNR